MSLVIVKAYHDRQKSSQKQEQYDSLFHPNSLLLVGGSGKEVVWQRDAENGHIRTRWLSDRARISALTQSLAIRRLRPKGLLPN